MYIWMDRIKMWQETGDIFAYVLIFFSFFLHFDVGCFPTISFDLRSLGVTITIMQLIYPLTKLQL